MLSVYVCVCVLIVFCYCWESLRNREFASSFVWPWENSFSLLWKDAKKSFMMMPWVEHKPLNCICVSELAKLQLRILNIQVTECQIRLIKMCTKCIESSIRPSGIWFTNVLRHLREDVRIECPDKLHPYNWQPHHDIMPAHTTWAVRNFWVKMTWLLAPLPPQFPILPLCACFLFSEMKIQLKDEDLIVNHRGGGQLHETGVLEVFPAVREAFTTVCKFQRGLLWRGQVPNGNQYNR